MTDIIEEIEVKKTRKPHMCFGCLEIIPVGSPAHVQVNNDMGIWRIYTHPACEEIIRGMDMHYDDDYVEGCVRTELEDAGFEGTPEEYVAQNIPMEIIRV